MPSFPSFLTPTCHIRTPAPVSRAILQLSWMVVAEPPARGRGLDRVRCLPLPCALATAEEKLDLQDF